MRTNCDFTSIRAIRRLFGNETATVDRCASARVRTLRPRDVTGAWNPATPRSVHQVGIPATARGDPALGMARLKADKVLTVPAYPLIEAAHYLNLPLSTLRAWCLGRPLRTDASAR